MSTAVPSNAVPPSHYNRLTLINLVANLCFLALYAAPLFMLDPRVAPALGNAHAPDLAVLGAAPPTVLFHLVAVSAAVLLGGVLLSGRKGVRLHRILGWAWVGCMAAAAVSSMFLRGIETGSFATGGFSFFHIITALVAILVPLAVFAARRHRVRWHAGLMIYVLINVLLSAGLLAMHPGFSGRLLPGALFN